MTPELQHALVYLLGTLAMAVPLTARAIPTAIERWSKARADAAAHALVVEKARADEMSDLRRRLESLEQATEECERRAAALRDELEHLRSSIGVARRHPR